MEDKESLKEYMLKEIDIIQDIIKRMGFNSFMIKRGGYNSGRCDFIVKMD